jgi:hypothetical protein
VPDANFLVTNLNDAGAGSLRDCITQANNSTDNVNYINFGPNVRSGTISLQSELPDFANNIWIHGPADTGAAAITVTRAAGAAADFAIFAIRAATTECGFDFLVITGGTQGGVVNYGPSMEIDDSVIGGNKGGLKGGGILNFGGLTLSNTVVTGNSATAGGGIYNDGGTVQIGNASWIASNSALYGGGIFNDYDGHVWIGDNSQVYNNTASLRGGGIFNVSTVSMTGGSLASNSAGVAGGGMYQTGSDASTYFSSVSIAGNTVTATDGTGKGGGCCIDGGYVAFQGTTSVENNSATNGPGLAYNTSNGASFSIEDSAYVEPTFYSYTS